jgi:hypothetical protein
MFVEPDLFLSLSYIYMSKIINSTCHILSLKPIVNLKQGLMGFFTVICDTNSSIIIKIIYLLYFYGNTLVSNNILYMKDHVRKPVIYLLLVLRIRCDMLSLLFLTYIYMKDSEIGPVPQTCPIILWRQISTWESKNKPDSIVMSNSPKHVWFGPTNVPDFTKKQHYSSYACLQFCPCFSVITIL